MLDWRMANGSMPLGKYDAVDPELAQFDHLPLPNPDAHLHNTCPMPSSGRPVYPVSEWLAPA